MDKILIIRPPHTYRYNTLDVREDAIISYWIGYLDAIGISRYQVFDFHLDRTLDIDRIAAEPGHGACVISCRETGDNIFYALRIGIALLERTGRQIIFYGQTGRLAMHAAFRQLKRDYAKRVEIVLHDEGSLAEILGFRSDGPKFGCGLQLKPYLTLDMVNVSHRDRVKASIETTRGCHFPCKFCFINSSQNYPSKWRRRPNGEILEDLRIYYEAGVHSVVFNDSEFFGADSDQYPQVAVLLEEIVRRFPKLQFKIYARADTLLKFGNIPLLKQAGLVSVFIGVESLVDEDLVALKKKTTSAALHCAIKSLSEAGVFMDLSFILFNRNTTLSTLEENLGQISLMYGRNSRFLGMPFFSFSFESAWKEESGRSLSPRTYVALDLAVKTPAASGAVFNPKLEPLMEVYRLLAYEWSAKVTQLNAARAFANPSNRARIEAWFTALPFFCLEVMKHFLQVARDGELTLDTLNLARDSLYEVIKEFYRETLPVELRDCATYDAHGSRLNYLRPITLLEPKEYWNDVIPPLHEGYWKMHTLQLLERA
jgi:hypothetical protein